MGIANERALYVISIDADRNRVTAGPAEELLSSEFTVAQVNWIAFDDPKAPVRAEVRVRYRHTAASATITPLANNRARIVFDEPQRAITPGQASVFYRGDEVVGGGWIVKSV
jgi:tRNA-specific 2-thiouridylase